jgi:hypothetical protein
MTFFRNILHDLVEKRLWPVALALCAALIAIPMLMKKDAPVPTGSSSGPSTATLADASVEAVDSPARARLDVGKERNPFQPNKPKVTRSEEPSNSTPSETTPTDTASTGAGSGGGDVNGDVNIDVGGGGGGGTPTDTTPTTPGTTPIPEPPAPGEMAWTLDVQFGKDGDTKPLKAVLPGRALPSTSDPVLIYLAAVDGGKGARFLVSSDARPQGDGKCKPSEKTCTEITLMKGDTAFFDVAKDNATVQYELELTDVVKRTVGE